MKKHVVGVIMNGVTGRMGTNQHLNRSILPMIREGGLRLDDDRVIIPDPILVGRNPSKLEALAEASSIKKWSTDLDAVLGDSEYSIYFDAQLTSLRVDAVKKAIRAGKHIYCEKPTALNTDDALELYQLAEKKPVKHGVVQDKLWLPGLLKLKGLIESGFFGRILSVRGEFGYWVFQGEYEECQRPSWNYQREKGGGIIEDMFPHWRYVLDSLFGEVRRVTCTAATHIEERLNESGERYKCTAEDAAYATFELDDGIIAHFNSSWCVRVRRDDLLTIQVDGTRGSAVAGLRGCYLQPLQGTPRPVWNPDIESPIDYLENWMMMPDRTPFENAFRAEWELFLQHVVNDEPFPWDLLEGAKGVQLADLGRKSFEQREWVEVPELDAN